MRNCFHDVHKWLDDVEVENFISDLRNAPKHLAEKNCNNDSGINLF